MPGPCPMCDLSGSTIGGLGDSSADSGPSDYTLAICEFLPRSFHLRTSIGGAGWGRGAFSRGLPIVRGEPFSTDSALGVSPILALRLGPDTCRSLVLLHPTPDPSTVPWGKCTGQLVHSPAFPLLIGPEEASKGLAVTFICLLD